MKPQKEPRTGPEKQYREGIHLGGGTHIHSLPLKQFTLDWYKELGWKGNPFTTSVPEPVEYFITGYENERQKLNYFTIQHQSFGTISAPKGGGATTLALWLGKELGKYKGRIPAVYIPLTGLGTIDFLHTIITSTLSPAEQILIHTYFRMGGHALQHRIGEKLQWDWLAHDSFYSSIAFKHYTSLDAIRSFLSQKLADKYLLIILDRVEHMHKQHAQILQSFFYAHLPIQVVAVGTKEALSKAPLRIIQKKDALRIRLSPLTPKETYNLLAKRILHAGGKTPYPLTEQAVKKMYEHCEKNPRQILSACQEYCVKEALAAMRKRQEAHPGRQADDHHAAHPAGGHTPKQPIKPAPLQQPASRPEPLVHPYTGETLSTAAADTGTTEEGQGAEPAAKPSFEIPPEILKQIEHEERIAKIQAKKDDARKKHDGAYSITVHSNEPTDEEVDIVETLVEESPSLKQQKTGKTKTKAKK